MLPTVKRKSDHLHFGVPCAQIVPSEEAHCSQEDSALVSHGEIILMKNTELVAPQKLSA